MLTPYRVLDLTQENGTLAGQVLADLGADVIQVEPLGGASGRRLAPFYQGRNDGEHSLVWWGYSRGKRSIELDLETQRDTFLELVQTADILIESEPVGRLASLGLGAEDLADLHPALIYVSITPYGITGPKADWAATDLTLVASAGPMAQTGDSDKPPVRVTVPQAWQHAAAEAFVGALAALHERNRSGLGQHVVVSAQQACTLATQGNILASAVNEQPVARAAGGIVAGEMRIRLTYPAKDGHVSITHIFGATVGPATRRLMEYVYECGFCDEATRDKDWVAYGLLLATGEEPIAEFERVKACVAACTASKSKTELLEAAMERRLLLAPMTTIEDVFKSEQFASRRYFTKPTGDGPASEIAFPGPFAKFSATPLQPNRRPPRLGEHTDEVLAEIRDRKASSKPPEPQASSEALPLAGLKVLDFMWALAGPGATRAMADLGATVIRIESSTRLDVCRTIRPFIDGDELPEKSAIFHSTNAGKRMLTVDLNTEAGKAVIRDLVAWADVVTESFSPRAMKAFGLDYESLCKINPDLIMLSTCLMGQTGPLALFAGYGNLAAAVTGFYSITGWADREPAGPFGAYTDYIAPRFNAAAVMAALDHRRRTGQGQHIDLAQAEAAMHFLTPALLDYAANGHTQSREGNRDLNWAPHGAYPTQGEDRHITIACTSDAHWRALADVLGLENPDDYASEEARLKKQDELDELIAAATVRLEGYELEAQLQAKGVPSAMVQNSPELVADPQLNHLGHFITLPHHEAGQTVIESIRVHLSRSGVHVDDSAPTFSRDMMYVLKEVLCYDDEKIGELLVAGVFE